MLHAERRDGVGIPLVLIHGFGGSCRDWDGMVAALPPDRPLLIYDQRGFGQSTTDARPYSHADDLLALLDALDITQADLCGLSLGGATALNFALDHPQRVRRLVLVSPLMVGWTWTSDWIERWKTIGRAARAGDMPQARQSWWEHPLFDSLRGTPAAPAMQAGIEAFHGRQWVEDLQRPAPSDADRLESLTTLTLLITGARDTADFRAIGDAIERAPQVRRIDHTDAGHMLNLEIPATLAADIEAFLTA